MKSCDGWCMMNHSRSMINYFVIVIIVSKRISTFWFCTIFFVMCWNCKSSCDNTEKNLNEITQIKVWTLIFTLNFLKTYKELHYSLFACWHVKLNWRSNNSLNFFLYDFLAIFKIKHLLRFHVKFRSSNARRPKEFVNFPIMYKMHNMFEEKSHETNSISSLDFTRNIRNIRWRFLRRENS